MKKVFILTYYVGVDGMEGEAAFKFIEDFKATLTVPDELRVFLGLPDVYKVFSQVIPTRNQNDFEFKIDTITIEPVI